jgi:hypothetical protein
MRAETTATVVPLPGGAAIGFTARFSPTPAGGPDRVRLLTGPWRGPPSSAAVHVARW